MPFDNTTLRQPRVTVLPPTRADNFIGTLPPPTPRERGGGPQRIVINIEIVQRHPPQRATGGYRFGTLTMTLLIIGLLVALLGGCTPAMAQPSSWQSHQDGFMTRYQGTDRDGGQWTEQRRPLRWPVTTTSFS
jgi:hypothetical protein